MTPEWQGLGVCGTSLVQVGSNRMVWAGPLATLKWPAQPVPFWSQNCGLAMLAVAGAELSSSSGALSSLDSRLPLASEV